MSRAFPEVSLSRSENMRAVRSNHSATTERRLRAAFASRGIRGWQMHTKDVLGTPDFYFHSSRLAVFVDGCFWHWCPHCGHVPSTNRKYWATKLGRNRRRDRNNGRLLRSAGIKVLRFWECELRKDLQGCLNKVRGAIASPASISAPKATRAERRIYAEGH